MKNMKTLSMILSLFGVMAVFGFGFTMNRNVQTDTDVEQIHLSCWDEQGQSHIERIRMVLNRDMHGLAWFSNFNGDPTGEGRLVPNMDMSAARSRNMEVNIIGGEKSFTAQIPNFVFQPHIRSLRVTVEKGETSTPLECRKINLAKRQSSNDLSLPN